MSKRHSCAAKCNKVSSASPSANSNQVLPDSLTTTGISQSPYTSDRMGYSPERYNIMVRTVEHTPESTADIPKLTKIRRDVPLTTISPLKHEESFQNDYVSQPLQNTVNEVAQPLSHPHPVQPSLMLETPEARKIDIASSKQASPKAAISQKLYSIPITKQPLNEPGMSSIVFTQPEQSSLTESLQPLSIQKTAIFKQSSKASRTRQQLKEPDQSLKGADNSDRPDLSQPLQIQKTAAPERPIQYTTKPEVLKDIAMSKQPSAIPTAEQLLKENKKMGESLKEVVKAGQPLLSKDQLQHPQIQKTATAEQRYRESTELITLKDIAMSKQTSTKLTTEKPLRETDKLGQYSKEERTQPLLTKDKLQPSQIQKLAIAEQPGRETTEHTVLKDTPLKEVVISEQPLLTKDKLQPSQIQKAAIAEQPGREITKHTTLKDIAMSKQPSTTPTTEKSLKDTDKLHQSSQEVAKSRQTLLTKDQLSPSQIQKIAIAEQPRRETTEPTVSKDIAMSKQPFTTPTTEKLLKETEKLDQPLEEVAKSGQPLLTKDALQPSQTRKTSIAMQAGRERTELTVLKDTRSEEVGKSGQPLLSQDKLQPSQIQKTAIAEQRSRETTEPMVLKDTAISKQASKTSTTEKALKETEKLDQPLKEVGKSGQLLLTNEDKLQPSQIQEATIAEQPGRDTTESTPLRNIAIFKQPSTTPATEKLLKETDKLGQFSKEERTQLLLTKDKLQPSQIQKIAIAEQPGRETTENTVLKDTPLKGVVISEQPLLTKDKLQPSQIQKAAIAEQPGRETTKPTTLMSKQPSTTPTTEKSLTDTEKLDQSSQEVAKSRQTLLTKDQLPPSQIQKIAIAEQPRRETTEPTVSKDIAMSKQPFTTPTTEKLLKETEKLDQPLEEVAKSGQPLLTKDALQPSQTRKTAIAMQAGRERTELTVLKDTRSEEVGKSGQPLLSQDKLQPSQIQKTAIAEQHSRETTGPMVLKDTAISTQASKTSTTEKALKETEKLDQPLEEDAKSGQPLLTKDALQHSQTRKTSIAMQAGRERTELTVLKDTRSEEVGKSGQPLLSQDKLQPSQIQKTAIAEQHSRETTEPMVLKDTAISKQASKTSTTEKALKETEKLDQPLKEVRKSGQLLLTNEDKLQPSQIQEATIAEQPGRETTESTALKNIAMFKQPSTTPETEKLLKETEKLDQSLKENAKSGQPLLAKDKLQPSQVQKTAVTEQRDQETTKPQGHSSISTELPLEESEILGQSLKAVSKSGWPLLTKDNLHTAQLQKLAMAEKSVEITKPTVLTDTARRNEPSPRPTTRQPLKEIEKLDQPLKKVAESGQPSLTEGRLKPSQIQKNIIAEQPFQETTKHSALSNKPSVLENDKISKQPSTTPRAERPLKETEKFEQDLTKSGQSLTTKDAQIQETTRAVQPVPDNPEPTILKQNELLKQHSTTPRTEQPFKEVERMDQPLKESGQPLLTKDPLPPSQMQKTALSEQTDYELTKPIVFKNMSVVSEDITTSNHPLSTPTTKETKRFDQPLNDVTKSELPIFTRGVLKPSQIQKTTSAEEPVIETTNPTVLRAVAISEQPSTTPSTERSLEETEIFQQSLLTEDLLQTTQIQKTAKAEQYEPDTSKPTILREPELSEQSLLTKAHLWLSTSTAEEHSLQEAIKPTVLKEIAVSKQPSATSRSEQQLKEAEEFEQPLKDITKSGQNLLTNDLLQPSQIQETSRLGQHVLEPTKAAILKEFALSVQPSVTSTTEQPLREAQSFSRLLRDVAEPGQPLLSKDILHPLQMQEALNAKQLVQETTQPPILRDSGISKRLSSTKQLFRKTASELSKEDIKFTRRLSTSETLKDETELQAIPSLSQELAKVPLHVTFQLKPLTLLIDAEQEKEGEKSSESFEEEHSSVEEPPYIFDQEEIPALLTVPTFGMEKAEASVQNVDEYSSSADSTATIEELPIPFNVKESESISILSEEPRVPIAFIQLERSSGSTGEEGHYRLSLFDTPGNDQVRIVTPTSEPIEHSVDLDPSRSSSDPRQPTVTTGLAAVRSYTLSLFDGRFSDALLQSTSSLDQSSADMTLISSDTEQNEKAAITGDNIFKKYGQQFGEINSEGQEKRRGTKEGFQRESLILEGRKSALSDQFDNSSNGIQSEILEPQLPLYYYDASTQIGPQGKSKLISMVFGGTDDTDTNSVDEHPKRHMLKVPFRSGKTATSKKEPAKKDRDFPLFRRMRRNRSQTSIDIQPLIPASSIAPDKISPEDYFYYSWTRLHSIHTSQPQSQSRPSPEPSQTKMPIVIISSPEDAAPLINRSILKPINLTSTTQMSTQVRPSVSRRFGEREILSIEVFPTPVLQKDSFTAARHSTSKPVVPKRSLEPKISFPTFYPTNIKNDNNVIPPTVVQPRVKPFFAAERKDHNSFNPIGAPLKQGLSVEIMSQDLYTGYDSRSRIKKKMSKDDVKPPAPLTTQNEGTSKDEVPGPSRKNESKVKDQMDKTMKSRTEKSSSSQPQTTESNVKDQINTTAKSRSEKGGPSQSRTAESNVKDANQPKKNESEVQDKINKTRKPRAEQEAPDQPETAESNVKDSSQPKTNESDMKTPRSRTAEDYFYYPSTNLPPR